MTIQERLDLRTTGTQGVIALAEALERAAKAQKSIESIGGGGFVGGRGPASRISEIDARGAVQFQLNKQQAINKLILERVKQEGQGNAAALRFKEKELALEKQRELIAFRQTRERGLTGRQGSRERVARLSKGGAGGNALQALLDGQGAEGVLKALGMDELAVGVIGATVAVGAAAAIGAAKFGAAVVQAQAYREDVSRGLEVILKSKSEADRVLKQASETSDFLGKERAETAGQFVDLLAKGFDPQKVDEITRRLADLSTVDPRANLDGLSRAIGQIAGKGRLQGDEILQLAEAGLETGDVYAALAKSMGKTVPEIIKLQSAGKISAKEGIQGILDAIAGQTGNQGAGVAAHKKSLEDMTGLLTRLKAIPGNILFDVEVGPGLESTKSKMREVIEFFDAGSASGKEVRRVVADTFNALAEGLFGIDPKKTGGVTETLQAILDVVKNSRGEIKEFAAGVAAIGSGFAWVAGVGAKISAAKQAIVDFFGFQPPGGFWGALFLAPIGIIKNLLQTLAPDAYQAGVDLVTGLANGISSTAQAVIDAVTNTVGGAIAYAKKILGIASPSRVFMEMGGYTSEGFALGIASNDNHVTRAAAAMAGNAVQGAAGAAFAPPGQGGGIVGAGQTSAGATPSAPISLVVNIAELKVMGGRGEEAAEAEGRAAARGLRSELRAILPGLIREVA